MLDSWKNFVNNPSSEADIGVFFTLFHERKSKKDFIEIFSSFPSHEALVERAIEYKRGPNTVSKVEIEQLIIRDLVNKENLCRKLGDQELVTVLNTVKSKIIEVDYSLFKTQRKLDIPNGWLIELIGDELRNKRIINDKKTKALFEAFYGWTTNFQLVWFLGAPLIDVEYDASLYFDIWKGGWDYIICEDSIWLASIP